MRAIEIVLETTVRKVNLVGIEITIDDHYLDRLDKRLNTREAPKDQVEQVINRIPEVKRQIKRLESGQKFWIYDQDRNIALGMRKYQSLIDRMNVQVKTVVGNKPWDSDIPVIILP